MSEQTIKSSEAMHTSRMGQCCLNNSAQQRKNWQVCGGGYGIYWPDIDEDLSTEGLLRGAPAPRGKMSHVA